MLGKPAIGLLTILCVTRSLQVQSLKAMNNYTSVHSVVYVTVPSDEVAKKLAQ